MKCNVKSLQNNVNNTSFRKKEPLLKCLKQGKELGRAGATQFPVESFRQTL